MKIEMHPLASDFRHIMEDEMKNWRCFGYTPDHWRIDDWPRYRNAGPGDVPDKNKVTYFEFSTKDLASAYIVDLALSHAMREIAKKQIRELRKQNRRKTERRTARINKGNPHVL